MSMPPRRIGDVPPHDFHLVFEALKIGLNRRFQARNVGLCRGFQARDIGFCGEIGEVGGANLAEQVRHRLGLRFAEARALEAFGDVERVE